MTAKAKPKSAGPKALSGSREAKRKAAVILETLCGLRTTQSASEQLGIAVVRYYVLETRMLQAMIQALEPQARGRQRAVQTELAQLRDDKRRLEREVQRLQAMYRITQRAVGVSDGKKTATKGKTTKTRRPRRQSRGERVLASMRTPEEMAPPSATLPGDQDQGGT